MSDENKNDDLAEQAIRSYGLKQEISRLHKEMMPTVGQQRSGAPVFSIGRVFLKVAASIVLVVCSYTLYVYFGSSGTKLYDEAFMPYTAVSMRGTTDSVESIRSKQFATAYQALEKGDIKSAIQGFLALSRGNGQLQFHDDAEYYLALAYLKDQQTTNAYTLFKKIREDSDHLYHKTVSQWFMVKLRIVSLKK